MMLAVKMKAFLEILETTNLIKIKIYLHTGFYKSNVSFLSIETKYSLGLGKVGKRGGCLETHCLETNCFETLSLEISRLKMPLLQLLHF